MPTYVTGDCNDIPSMRLFDGNLGILTGNIEKLAEKLAILKIHWSVLPVKEAIQATHDKQVELTLTQADRTVQAVNTVQSANSATTTMTGARFEYGSMMSRNSIEHVAFSGPLAAGNDGTCWAAMVAETSISTPICFQTSTDGDIDNTHFQEVRRRRSIKRANKRPLEQSNNVVAAAAATLHIQLQREITRRILGKVPSSNNNNLIAVNKIVKKAVFCVDNVDKSCLVGHYLSDLSDLQSFVTSL